MEKIQHRNIEANGHKHPRGGDRPRPRRPLPPRFPGALVLMAPPDAFPLLQRLPRYRPLPPRLRRLRCAASLLQLHRLPHNRRFGRRAGCSRCRSSFLVGHDWGAVMAWNFCLLRPDRIRALVNTSVVFHPRNPNWKPLESMRAILGDDYYICRFQKPGEIEEEFSRAGTERIIKKFLSIRNPAPPMIPKPTGFDCSPDKPITTPSWLSEEDVSYYVSKYNQRGFTGGLNYYRVMDLNWELTAPWTGVPIKVPVKFIVGDLDMTYNTAGVKEYIRTGGFKKHVPFLQELVIMEGVAHFLNQEKPDEINQHIYDFIQRF